MRAELLFFLISNSNGKYLEIEQAGVPFFMATTVVICRQAGWAFFFLLKRNGKYLEIVFGTLFRSYLNTKSWKIFWNLLGREGEIWNNGKRWRIFGYFLENNNTDTQPITPNRHTFLQFEDSRTFQPILPFRDEVLGTKMTDPGR